jgi:hypothetical protein
MINLAQPTLVARSAALALQIEFLAQDFLFTQRIMVARPVEIDNVTLARIFKNRTIPI